MTHRERFFSELKASQSFQALNAQQQQELHASYKNAAEGVFESGLRVIRAVEAKLQQKLKKIDADQGKLALEIKTTLQRLTKAELQQNEAKDRQDLPTVLADLDKQIDAL